MRQEPALTHPGPVWTKEGRQMLWAAVCSLRDEPTSKLPLDSYAAIPVPDIPRSSLRSSRARRPPLRDSSAHDSGLPLQLEHTFPTPLGASLPHSANLMPEFVKSGSLMTDGHVRWRRAWWLGGL